MTRKYPAPLAGALALTLLLTPLALSLAGCDPQPAAPSPEASAAAAEPEASPETPAAEETTMGPPPPGPPAPIGDYDKTPFKGNGKPVTTKSGLKYEDMKVGTGPEATPGKTAIVHYTGTLTNGTKFDSSRDRGEPFEFTVGAGMVIQGWDEGVAGMKVGGRRKLTVPGNLAYGPTPPPGAPFGPNETLVFDVELMGVR